MPSVLRIDAGSRTSGSHSRALADAFEHAWRVQTPDATVVRRDLVATPIEPISEATIAAFYTPADRRDAAAHAALRLSDALIGELQAADTVLVATPMYNFSVPAALKAWIDQVVRINETFAYDGQRFTGLVKARRVIVAAAFGAAGYGEAFKAADFVTPYLTFLFGFLGVPDVTVVSAEATTADAATVAANLDRARAALIRRAEAV